jgi:hypothetical protein
VMERHVRTLHACEVFIENSLHVLKSPRAETH